MRIIHVSARHQFERNTTPFPEKIYFIGTRSISPIGHEVYLLLETEVFR